MTGRTRPPRRHAVVTGASSGIGRSIAQRLAADGAQVLLVARDVEALDRACDEIRRGGGRAERLAIDITKPDAGVAVVDFALQVLGGMDILVNCASATRNDDFFALTDEQWAEGFAVKVFAAIRLSRSAWPALRESGGSIVNICGIGARTPTARNVMTGALSASLLAITKALAERGVTEGVQVNAINPGLILTPRIESTIGRAAPDAGEPLDQLERKIRQMGAIRLGRPEDVASLVAYIVSPEGELLQGAIIDLDGGATKGL
jgi:NAD(P)-dependent dehydrogenase (short-subunit alcohol dehydrogenase family)